MRLDDEAHWVDSHRVADRQPIAVMTGNPTMATDPRPLSILVILMSHMKWNQTAHRRLRDLLTAHNREHDMDAMKSCPYRWISTSETLTRGAVGS